MAALKCGAWAALWGVLPSPRHCHCPRAGGSPPSRPPVSPAPPPSSPCSGHFAGSCRLPAFPSAGRLSRPCSGSRSSLDAASGLRTARGPPPERPAPALLPPPVVRRPTVPWSRRTLVEPAVSRCSFPVCACAIKSLLALKVAWTCIDPRSPSHLPVPTARGRVSVPSRDLVCSIPRVAGTAGCSASRDARPPGNGCAFPPRRAGLPALEGVLAVGSSSLLRRATGRYRDCLIFICLGVFQQYCRC